MSAAEQSTWVSRLLASLIAKLLRHRGVALVAAGLVVAAALGGLARLRVDFSSRAFYGDASAGARQLAEFHEVWGADDDTLLVLVHPRAADDPAGVLTGERLEVIASISGALAGSASVVDARSIADMPLPRPGSILGGALEPTDLASLAATLGLADMAIADRRELLASLPFVPTLLSADGRDTVIAVQLAFSSDDVARTRAAIVELEAILAEHDAALAARGLTRELAGIPAIRAGFFELVVRDQALFIPLMLTIVALSLLLVFRRLHGVLIPALAAGVPTAMLLGIMGWTGEPIGLLNQAYFTLLPVIAVADAIHLLARYHEELRELGDGEPRELAIVRAGSRVGVACLLTSLTTAAGFASLGVARMPILRGFGLYAALGIGLAFVVAIVVVPILLTFTAAEREPPKLPGTRVLDAGVQLCVRRPWLVVVGGIGLLALALIPAQSVRIDNTLSGLLEPEHPTSVASRRVDAQLGGVLSLELEIIGEPGVDLREPAVLATLGEFETWLAEQPEVRAVEGLATIVAATGPLLGEAAEVPGSREAIAARIDAIAPHAPIDRLVRDDGRRLRVRAGVPDAGGQQFVALAERAEARLRTELGELDVAIDAHATGTALLAYRGVNGITHDLRNSFALVFVVVVVLIGVLFRSVWPALVAILPNFGPLLLGYALVGLTGKVLDPLAAVILTLALGIAVDDTLHVMVRTREQLRGGGDVESALRVAIRRSGRAVAVTSVVIVAGLSLNLASSFPPLQLLGLLGAVVIGLSLVANLTVLPASIVLLRGRGLGTKS